MTDEEKNHAQGLLNHVSGQRNRAMDEAAQLAVALEAAYKKIKELEAKPDAD